MSDKPLIQQELAENLAAMIHAQSDDRAVQYLTGFWHTIGREWGGIDRLRCVSGFPRTVGGFWMQGVYTCVGFASVPLRAYRWWHAQLF
jgi:hypothetical protein